ncbi:hypothetical protein KSC_072080 [Ktedonobacter sp. SOSP1-52]|nr:hypothetical protein KSC_072080 [Ktedonobacter sp. SOSP1-52]
MKTNTPAPSDKGFRFPPEIISHAVWLSFRFSLSFRDVEELLEQRGIVVSYETVRQWCLKFGQTYANELRRRHPKTGDTWHMDEVYLKINGKTHYVWRAVDQYGNMLDILVQSRGNKQAAKTFFRKLLKGLHYVPRVIIPDTLKSYGAAKREILPGVEHRQHKGFCQSSGKLTSTDATTREEHAAVEIGQTRTTLSFGLWTHRWTFPTTKASVTCRGVPCPFAGPIPAMA